MQGVAQNLRSDLKSDVIVILLEEDFEAGLKCGVFRKEARLANMDFCEIC